MATITTLANPLSPTPGAVVRHMDNSNWNYTSFTIVDFAKAAAAKGSALATGDVIQAVTVPPGSIIVRAWAQKVAAYTGGATVVTIDVGTSAASDQYVSGWASAGAAVNSWATPLGTGGDIVLNAADTVDLTLNTVTGSLTGGQVIIGVEVIDLNTKSRGAIAKPKS